MEIFIIKYTSRTLYTIQTYTYMLFVRYIFQRNTCLRVYMSVRCKFPAHCIVPKVLFCQGTDLPAATSAPLLCHLHFVAAQKFACRACRSHTSRPSSVLYSASTWTDRELLSAT
jgi:hypothetical protein